VLVKRQFEVATTGKSCGRPGEKWLKLQLGEDGKLQVVDMKRQVTRAKIRRAAHGQVLRRARAACVEEDQVEVADDLERVDEEAPRKRGKNDFGLLLAKLESSENIAPGQLVVVVRTRRRGGKLHVTRRPCSTHHVICWTVVSNVGGHVVGAPCPLACLYPYGPMAVGREGVFVVLVGYVWIDMNCCDSRIERDETGVLTVEGHVIGNVVEGDVKPGWCLAKVHGLHDAMLDGLLPQRYVDFVTLNAETLVEMGCLAAANGQGCEVMRCAKMIGVVTLEWDESVEYWNEMLFELLVYGHYDIAHELCESFGADPALLHEEYRSGLCESREGRAFLKMMGCDV
jgi:hypothetical protein